MAIVVRRGIDGHRMDFVVPFLDKTTYINIYIYLCIYIYINMYMHQFYMHM
jgi:hypothetical protein